MPLRVAIDTNVLLAGLGWPRWQYEILKPAARGDFILVLSPIVIQEAKRRIKGSFPHLIGDFETLLENIEYELAPMPSKEEVADNQGLVRDKTDIPLALSIIAAEVDYFVTYDRDFTDKDETTARVREAIPGIMLPLVFLRDVMGWTSTELEEIRHREWTHLESMSHPQCG